MDDPFIEAGPWATLTLYVSPPFKQTWKSIKDFNAVKVYL